MIDTLTIAEFFRKISLPKRYFKEEFVILQKYIQEKDIFFEHYKKCKGNEFNGKNKEELKKVLADIQDKIEENFQSIIEIFNAYENANPSDAQKIFDSFMKRNKEFMFVSMIDGSTEIENDSKKYLTKIRINEGNSYFRVRAVESRSEEIESNPNEMFHIPFSKRQNLGNERFSIAGFPCLYLASMLPLAWQETGYPKKYYYSEFKYINDVNNDSGNELKFISLYSPNEINHWGGATKYNHFDLWLQIIKRYLITYPLTLACSFVNQNGRTPYKQEYIIPQMLMQWVQRNIGYVQGISYFTCIDTSDFLRNWCAYDLALPALYPLDENKYSERLKEKLTWSRPAYYSIPIADKRKNLEDQRIIDNLKSELFNALCTFDFQDELGTCIRKMLELLVCLQSLFEISQNGNMKSVVNVMNFITSNYNSICKIDLEKILDKAKQEKNYLLDKEINEQCDMFVKLYNRFVDRSSNNSEIGKIIDKYDWSMWNFFFKR